MTPSSGATSATRRLSEQRKGSPVFSTPDRIGPDEMADLFSNLSEAINAVANAERDALETLRVAVT